MSSVRGLSLVILAGAAACGRLDFASITDASGSGSGPDGSTGAPPLFAISFDTADLGADSSGNNRHAACTPSCPTPGEGYDAAVGGASFSGNQCLVIGDEPALHARELTVTAWVRTTVGLNFFSRPLDGATSLANTWELFFDSNDSSIQTRIADVGFGHPVTSAWTHVAFTSDGTTARSYKDGVLQGEQTHSPLVYSVDGTYIGCDFNNGATGDYFIGSLDELRFYDRVLTQAEIAVLAR